MRVWLYGCNAQDIRAMRIHCVGGADIVIGFSTQKDRSFPRAGLARPMQAAMRGELDQLLVSSLSLLGDGGEQIGEMKKAFESYQVSIKSASSSGSSSS